MVNSYPRTIEEYWQIVDSHWDELYDILVRFLPLDKIKDADNLRLFKDPKLSDLFQDAWEAAPDDRSIHFIPSWKVLCDLCSESHLLFEENND